VARSISTLFGGHRGNVSSADHDSDLHAEGVHVFEFAGDGLDGFAVYAESLWSLKRLAESLSTMRL